MQPVMALQEQPGPHEIGMPTHWPPLQTSIAVHKSLSLQAVPLGLLGYEQAPVAGVQVPGSMWH